MLIQNAWAQDAAAAMPANTLQGLLFSYGPLLLIIAVFYFLVIRPQGQAARAHSAMLAALAKGDVVETNGGVIATVAKVTDKFIELTSGAGTLVLARHAVARKLNVDEIKLAGIKK
ncbi:MAG TPA: preprotein translocase subunit YajC [Alphaproteobacteria bacterium]|nr:preprotein translocase subunit YajC [Alphaproteobacteria bacterium]